jgi:hypothetical protein
LSSLDNILALSKDALILKRRLSLEINVMLAPSKTIAEHIHYYQIGCRKEMTAVLP